MAEFSKLQDFNLENALKGSPICTADGRFARIICSDYNGRPSREGYRILALVRSNDGDGYEVTRSYDNEGRCSTGDADDDLRMVVMPQEVFDDAEEHWGFVNVYSTKQANSSIMSQVVYPSMCEAMKHIWDKAHYVKTKQVHWWVFGGFDKEFHKSAVHSAGGDAEVIDFVVGYENIYDKSIQDDSVYATEAMARKNIICKEYYLETKAVRIALKRLNDGKVDFYTV